MISGLAGRRWAIKRTAAAWSRRELELRLFDLDVAGASADANGGAAAVDDAADMVFVKAALHGDGLRDVDAAGAGICVEIEVGVTNGQANGATASGELPVCGGLALCIDVAAAGAGFERACETLKADAATAGFGLDVAGAGLQEFNVAGAGAESGRALNAVDVDRAGAALRLD
jgi:hypothetical protein